MPVPNGYNTVPSFRYLEEIAGGLGSVGTAYYVDGNAGNDANDGLSWGTAFATLPVALAASHADIAAGAFGWASRNRIFIKGDSFGKDAVPVNLTKLAQKTDIIGVGSCDHRHMAMIIGNHVIDTVSYMGCRFFNVGLRGPTVGGKIMKLPTEQSGIAFLGCTFDGVSGTLATDAIEAAGVESLTVKGCRFIGKFSTSAVSILAGVSNSLDISENYVESGAIGVKVASGVSCAVRGGVIRNNFFNTTGAPVSDASNVMVVAGNRGCCGTDGKLATTLPCNVVLCSDNHFSHAAGNSIYPVVAAITAP